MDIKRKRMEVLQLQRTPLQCHWGHYHQSLLKRDRHSPPQALCLYLGQQLVAASQLPSIFCGPLIPVHISNH